MDDARGLLRLTGPQRIWFLQQTITAEVEDLTSGRWRESAFLTPKGKLVAHFRVGVLGDDVWIDIDPPTTDLVEWFTKYRFRTKVDIEDRSGTVRTFAGPDAADLAVDGEIEALGDGVVFGAALGDVPIAIVHGDSPVGATPASDDELEQLRIEAGVSRFGVDYTTDNLPQEAGLTRIVPVDRGCYVGQETVARIHFRGHVNKVVRPLSFDDPASGAFVGRGLELDGQRIGTITSVAGSYGIGMVRADVPEGASVAVDGGRAARVGPVPEGTKVSREGGAGPRRRHVAGAKRGDRMLLPCTRVRTSCSTCSSCSCSPGSAARS